jgi:hypothetical protein
MDAPNMDTPRMPRGELHLVSSEALDEDFEEGLGEHNVFPSVAPSIAKRIFRASAVFLCLVLIGVGGAFAWRSYGD